MLRKNSNLKIKDVTRRTKRERKLLDETPLKICWEKGNWREKETAAKKKQKRKMKRGENGIGNWSTDGKCKSDRCGTSRASKWCKKHSFHRGRTISARYSLSSISSSCYVRMNERGWHSVKRWRKEIKTNVSKWMNHIP